MEKTRRKDFLFGQEGGEVQNIKREGKRTGTKNKQKQINENTTQSGPATHYSPYLSPHWKAVQEAAGLLLTMPESELNSDDLIPQVLLLCTNQISYTAN